MSKYSSDSDTSARRRRSRKRRSYSSSSSSSSYHRKANVSKRHGSWGYRKSKREWSKSRRWSRSRSRSSSRNSRSTSKDRHRRRSTSRYRDRYRNKCHHKSRSHSKGHSSRYPSRSSSNDTRSRQSRSPFRSNSSSSNGSKKVMDQEHKEHNKITNSEEQLREKLLKAIRAVESADYQLKQQGVLPKSIKSRNDLSSLTNGKPQYDIIKAIEDDEFVQKTFTSSTNSKANAEELSGTVDLANANFVPEGGANSIFHATLFCDSKLKYDRWVKKLYQTRQKVISGEPIA